MSVNPEDIEYLRTIPTGYVTDAFSRLGLSGWFSGLRSSFPLGNRRIVGLAATVWLAPVRGKKRKGNLYSVMRELPEGCVVMVAGGSSEGATIGSNAATQAQVSGMEAVVIDGSIRDLAEVRKMSLPILYRSVAIRVATWLEVAATGVPVTVAGAQVWPGDIIFADEDGGLVIPPDYLADVVRNAADVARLEAEQDQIIRNRGSLDDLASVLQRKKEDPV
jgi:4-hydroxy-4-methyl-2-oxoglutarate aldolase